MQTLVWLQSVCWWRRDGGGVRRWRGGVDLRETASRLARCVCVCFEGVCKLQQCALPALLAGEKASALSCQYGAAPMTPVRCFFSLSSFFLPLFLLLSLQKPLPCPPLCPLCRQKAGITAPPQQVRCYFVLSDASIWGEIFWLGCFIAWKITSKSAGMKSKLVHQLV